MIIASVSGDAVPALQAFPGASRTALARALNRGAIAGRQEAVQAIRERYPVRAVDVRRVLTISRATPEAPAITITARSPALAIGRFPHSPSAPGTGGRGKRAMRVEVLRGSRKPLGGAFVAPLPSGLRVMRRTGLLTAAGKQGIESVFGPPLALMLNPVRERVIERALEMTQARLAHELERAR